MSVLIKGMEMPKNCNECPLHFYEGQGICCCRALPAIDDDEILKPWKNKRKDCPLVSIPPHGRLIDADALLNDLFAEDYKEHPFCYPCGEIICAVKNASDILEAEMEE